MHSNPAIIHQKMEVEKPLAQEEDQESQLSLSSTQITQPIWLQSCGIWKNKAKGGETVLMWLLWLWDDGADNMQFSPQQPELSL